MTRARVIVASNRAAAGVYQDTSGPLLVAGLRELGCDVDADPVVVPDGAPVAMRGSAPDGPGYQPKYSLIPMMSSGRYSPWQPADG